MISSVDYELELISQNFELFDRYNTFEILNKSFYRTIISIIYYLVINRQIKLGIIDVKKSFLIMRFSLIFDKNEIQKPFSITLIPSLPLLFNLLKHEKNIFDLTYLLSSLTNQIIDLVHNIALTKFYSNNKLKEIPIA